MARAYTKKNMMPILVEGKFGLSEVKRLGTARPKNVEYPFRLRQVRV